MSTKKVKAVGGPKVPKEKKVRVVGAPISAIGWFQNEAAKSGGDAEKVIAAAAKEGYSTSTISIQLGRLRANGQLPKIEKVPKEKKEKAIKAPKEKKEKAPKVKTPRAVPKPGRKEN